MRRRNPEINSGSMADISFLLLTFFLLTSSMGTNHGITRKLPPLANPTAQAPSINKRNIFNVFINKSDRLAANNKLIDISQLRQEAKLFLSNPQNSPNLAEKRTEKINELGTVYVSKGIISLKNDRGTSYNMYIKVQNELTAAVNELRNELALQKFGKKFDALNAIQQEALQMAIPMSISEAEPENVGGK